MIEVAFAIGLSAVPPEHREAFFHDFAKRLTEPDDPGRQSGIEADDLRLTPEEYDRLVTRPVKRLTRLIVHDEWGERPHEEET